MNLIFRIATWLLLLGTVTLSQTTQASPLSATTRERLATGQPINVIVEFDGTVADQVADTERSKRKLRRDDAAIRTLRAQGYARIKAGVENVARSSTAMLRRDFSHLPMAVWQVSSLAALQKLETQPGVRVIHEDRLLHAVSVSDLGFISQPQAAAQGALGAGTVIAVIDGGLGTNYTQYNDFGTCTAVNTPSSTCRVLYNQVFYSGASSVTAHGTNVSAIALDVAPSAKLAMYDVFNGSSALTSDIISAMNDIVSRFNTSSFNVAAVNLSLGDGTSQSTQCGSSNWQLPTYSAFNVPVVSLSNLGIIVVAAAGNSGSKSGLSDPACVPGVVSVGAVYDNAYGSISWGSPAACTDSTAADHVTCFSQSASYLSLLAPGSFVNAPTSAFQQSGTSQATPHVAGSIAVLRARYPAESTTQTIKRLKDTGVIDTDVNAGGRTTPRISLNAAMNEGIQLTLSGSGPTQATSGGNGTYTLNVTNNGPLAATNVQVINTLPEGATFISASTGCSYAAGVVTCTATSLAAGANIALTINVQWTMTGAVYDTATVMADQINTASAAQQQLAFGSNQGNGDAPLPSWAWMLTSMLLLDALRRYERGVSDPRCT